MGLLLIASASVAAEGAAVTGRALAANACRGDDLKGEWLAPPKFDNLYLGFERYADSAHDQNLWLDDIALSMKRVGCPGTRAVDPREGDQ